jgi:hypothetical protein
VLAAAQSLSRLREPSALEPHARLPATLFRAEQHQHQIIDNDGRRLTCKFRDGAYEMIPERNTQPVKTGAV